MRQKFASLQRPTEFGYAFDSEAWETSGSPVCHHFRMFQTYNDGLTQHSRDWPITVEYMADYLASLATAMLADPLSRDSEERNLVSAVHYDITRSPHVDSIEFAASVVFKPRANDADCGYEAKTRWYSMTERKISASPSKEHDKRYQRIEPWNDGTPGAIYRMLIPEYAHALEQYAYADAIRNWVLAKPSGSYNHYMPLTAEFLKWKEYADRRMAQDLRHAFSACVSLCESYRLRCSAETDLQNIRPIQPAAAKEDAA